MIFATRPAFAPLILRLTLALVMFPHGAQKALGMFDGKGWSPTMQHFTENMGLPTIVAVGVILLELVGPVLLLVGLGTRFVALAFAGLMVGAIYKEHLEYGFFMNWFGAQGGEGYEYHLLAIGIALALVMTGAGMLSLDRRFSSGEKSLTESRKRKEIKV